MKKYSPSEGGRLALFISVLLLASAICSTLPVQVEAQAVPAIKIESPPTSGAAGTKVTISWEVSGTGKIAHTAVHYDTKAGNPADFNSYAKATPDFAVLNPAQDAPKKYSASINVPSSGTVYYVVHALVDGKNIYNPDGEKTLAVIPLPGGGIAQKPPGVAAPPPGGAPEVGVYGGGVDSNVLLGIGAIVVIAVVAVVARSRMKKSK